ncbi:MAG: DUF3617 family protein [Gammaproteobacteria bacterium]
MSACMLQVLIVNPSFAADKIKYGEWEIHMTVHGMPMEVPSQTERICLDKQHLVPGEQQSHSCNVKWKIQDTTVSWNITCKNGARGSGSAVYHGDTMQGSSVMTMPGAPMKLRSTIDGKWIAAKCDVR